MSNPRRCGSLITMHISVNSDLYIDKTGSHACSSVRLTAKYFTISEPIEIKIGGNVQHGSRKVSNYKTLPYDIIKRIK